jgi:hypothetical protein
MGNLVADESGSCHGILHHVTLDQFKVLCGIESGYDVMAVPATPYQPYCSNSSSDVANGNHSSTNGNKDSSSVAPGTPLSPVMAQAFIIHPEKLSQLKKVHPDWETKLLPTERYITIITQGLRHFGADPAWVQHIASQDFKPDKTPGQHMTAPTAGDPNELPTWTQQQLAEHQGKLDGHRAIMSCGPKILEVDFSSHEQNHFVATMKQHMCGRDISFGLCQLLYDPRLPPLNSPNDVTDAHCAFAEDATCEWTRLQGMTVRQIGWLQKPQEGDCRS